MNPFRPIENSYHGSPFHMVGNGFRVMNFFPQGNPLAQRLNPFVLLDYNPPYFFPATTEPPGVGAHPHRGFETVTIAYQGAIAHHDSAGHHGIIKAGDVQWMTAGRGVLHKEYHEKEFARKGGTLQMVQLWVNLPQQLKFTPSRYQTLMKEDMGRVELPNKQGHVTIIAGEYMGVKGPAKTHTPIHLLDIRLKPQAQIRLTLPATYNTTLLILDGEPNVNQQLNAKQNSLIVFENREGVILLENGKTETTLLLLSAEPLKEPIAHYGPFVMNTEQQLQEALSDFRAGKFGHLDQ